MLTVGKMKITAKVVSIGFPNQGTREEFQIKSLKKTKKPYYQTTQSRLLTRQKSKTRFIFKEKNSTAVTQSCLFG